MRFSQSATHSYDSTPASCLYSVVSSPSLKPGKSDRAVSDRSVSKSWHENKSLEEIMYHILTSSFRVSSNYDIWMLASPKPHMPAHIVFFQPQDWVVQWTDSCLFGTWWCPWKALMPVKPAWCVQSRWQKAQCFRLPLCLPTTVPKQWLNSCRAGERQGPGSSVGQEVHVGGLLGCSRGETDSFNSDQVRKHGNGAAA